MSTARVVAHGSWTSPLSPSDAASGATRFSGLAVCPGADGRVDIHWAETRPNERGRIAIVGVDDDGTRSDLGPRELRIRSRVNEYGGGALWCSEGQVYWVDEVAQQIDRIDPSTQRATGQSWSPERITPAPPGRSSWRFASGSVAPGGEFVVAERESHTDDHGEPLTEARNEIVAIRCDRRELTVLITPGQPGGGDFVAAPTLSPDGVSLAWLRWDHPDMPWDAAELWVGCLELDGSRPRVSDRRRVAGGRHGGTANGLDRPVSACLPDWSPEGWLWWCDDADEWWHLHAASAPGRPPEGAGDAPSTAVPGGGSAGEELGEPRWTAGGRRYGFTDDGRVVAVISSQGLDSIWAIDPTSGERSRLPGPAFSAVEAVAVTGSTVVAIAGTADAPTSVWRIDLESGRATDLRPTTSPLDPEWVSRPVPVSFPTGASADGGTTEVAHALFYAPTSGDHVAPDGARPPLVVRIHGGPTAAARPEFSTSVQFWTTRGFAVADVNYRGSTGFGRAYRDRLLGNWGVVDVEDCLAVTRHLAAQGLVDGGRCVIRGGSAGGFTALAAVCNQSSWGFDGAFAAACSLYGVTDLAALAADTHKFESRYLDGLVAPLPEGAEVYRARSPLFHADRLDRPVLLLQGTDDKVVPPAQAEVLVEALRSNGVEHRYVLFPNEGHGFHLSDTIVAALEAELDFYGDVLGFEPA